MVFYNLTQKIDLQFSGILEEERNKFLFLLLSPLFE